MPSLPPKAAEGMSPLLQFRYGLVLTFCLDFVNHFKFEG